MTVMLDSSQRATNRDNVERGDVPRRRLAISRGPTLLLSLQAKLDIKGKDCVHDESKNVTYDLLMLKRNFSVKSCPPSLEFHKTSVMLAMAQSTFDTAF